MAVVAELVVLLDILLVVAEPEHHSGVVAVVEMAALVVAVALEVMVGHPHKEQVVLMVVLDQMVEFLHTLLMVVIIDIIMVEAAVQAMVDVRKMEQHAPILERFANLAVNYMLVEAQVEITNIAENMEMAAEAVLIVHAFAVVGGIKL